MESTGTIFGVNTIEHCSTCRGTLYPNPQIPLAQPWRVEDRTTSSYHTLVEPTERFLRAPDSVIVSTYKQSVQHLTLDLLSGIVAKLLPGISGMTPYLLSCLCVQVDILVGSVLIRKSVSVVVCLNDNLLLGNGASFSPEQSHNAPALRDNVGAVSVLHRRVRRAKIFGEIRVIV